MSKPLRYALVGLAIFVLWTLFGDRVQTAQEKWLAPIEPMEYSDGRGDPDAIIEFEPARESPKGPRRGRITDGIRERVEGHLERGARRNGP